MHEITSNPDLLLDSLDGHLYKTDTSVKWTSRIGPCFPILPFLTLHKTDTTLRQPLRVGTKGVHLKESWLYSEKFDDGQTATNINTKYKWASQGNVPHWVEEFLDCLQHSLWICFQTDTRVGGWGVGWGGDHCQRSLILWVVLLQMLASHCQMKEQRQFLLSNFKARSARGDPANNNNLYLRARNWTWT